MDKLIQGIIRFRKHVKPKLWPAVKSALEEPQPGVLFITCMDARLLPASFTSADPGDMFVIRNAGNIFPHSKLFGQDQLGAEKAALEVAISNGVSHIAICGHSDCKAMQCLHNTEGASGNDSGSQSPLVAWLRKHGSSSLTKLDQLEGSHQDGKKTVSFDDPGGKEKVQAIIDSDDKLSAVDRLSQVNVLQQLHHLKSDALVKRKVDEGLLHLHAMWFNLREGEMLMFSKKESRFIAINEDNYEEIVSTK